MAPDSVVAVVDALDFLGGTLELTDTSGTSVAEDLPFQLEPLQPRWYPGRCLVRFRSGSVTPLISGGASTLADYKFSFAGLRDTLYGAGINALRRLLPDWSPIKAHGLTLAGDSVRLDDLSDIYVAEGDPAMDVETMCKVLARQPNVVYAHADYSIQVCATPNDSLYSLQWGIHYPGSPFFSCGLTVYPNINADAPGAWDLSTGSPGTLIGILDTGLDRFHPDLASQFAYGVSFVGGTSNNQWQDDNDFTRHGTAVSGIVAASGNNL